MKLARPILSERDSSRLFEKVELIEWRLGVWVSSEKESKPKRGSSYLRKRCEGSV